MQSGFKGVHPIINMLFFVSVIAFSLSINYPFFVAVSLLFALSYDVWLRGKKAILGFFKIVLPVIILFTAFNFLFSHHGVTVIGKLPDGNSLTVESLAFGLMASLKFASMLLWLGCLGEVLTEEKIIYLFGRFSPRIALVISMAVRFIPMFRERLSEISLAQKGIGRDYSSGNILARIRNGGHIISILITWVLEKGIETANSMNARGYSLKGKSKYNKYKFSSRDGAILLSLLLFDVIVIIVASFGKFEAMFTPIIEIGSFSFLTFVGLLNMAILCLLPILIDIRDKKIW